MVKVNEKRLTELRRIEQEAQLSLPLIARHNTGPTEETMPKNLFGTTIKMEKDELRNWITCLNAVAKALRKGEKMPFTGSDPIDVIENLSFIIDQHLK